MQIIYFYMCVLHQQTTKEGNQRWSRYYTRKKLLLHVFSMLSQCYIGIGLGQQVRHIIMTFYLSQFVCVCGVWGIDYHTCFFLIFYIEMLSYLNFIFSILKFHIPKIIKSYRMSILTFQNHEKDYIYRSCEVFLNKTLSSAVGCSVTTSNELSINDKNTKILYKNL